MTTLFFYSILTVFILLSFKSIIFVSQLLTEDQLKTLIIKILNQIMLKQSKKMMEKKRTKEFMMKKMILNYLARILMLKMQFYPMF
jgi:hypothetical protein